MLSDKGDRDMAEKILVINPNSSETVTQAIDAAMAPLRIDGGPSIKCTTLAEGPPGIESQQDADRVIAPLLGLLRREERNYDAFVLACYSDPGLFSMREATRKPVLGIAECGLFTACTLGQKFGVIAILRKAIPRHLRYLAALGISGRLAAEMPLDLGVAQLSDGPRTFARLLEVGQALRDSHGADVLVLGCAGMTTYRQELQAALKIPVVDPTQAAVSMAIGRVCLKWHVAAE